MKNVTRWWIALAATLLFGLAMPAAAQTPDGRTPAEEDVCEPLRDAGRKSFGLCNAYCEAKDCDSFDKKSCRKLRRNMNRKTGTPEFPCDCSETQEYEPGVGCVCPADLVEECSLRGGVLDPETCGCSCPDDVVAECDLIGGVVDEATCTCSCAPPTVFDPQLGCICDPVRDEECTAVGGALNDACECVVTLCADTLTCEEGACPTGQRCVAGATACGCQDEPPTATVCGVDAQSGQCGGECPVGQDCVDLGIGAPDCRCLDAGPP